MRSLSCWLSPLVDFQGSLLRYQNNILQQDTEIFQHLVRFLSHVFWMVFMFNNWDLRQLCAYLKRVIVTPAVYQLFTPLNRSLKYWHWADITFYTQLYSLAESYVFVKQSDRPCNCTLISHPYEYDCRDPLYQRYRTNLPNSLNWIKLTHLRLLT